VIVDSSALVAVALGEPEAEDFRDVFEFIDDLKISAASYLEAAVVLDQRKPGALDRLATGLDFEVAPVDKQQVEIARLAYRQFGKGSVHAAQLNFGDCFTYALAKVTDEPVLFKGNDFSETDLECVSV
jgi:ribonuclease VapC